MAGFCATSPRIVPGSVPFAIGAWAEFQQPPWAAIQLPTP